MLGVPAATEFDLRFRILGIPVRVTPFFWLTAAFLGMNLRDGQLFVLWILAVLFSILVHEFGHALTARFFGQDPAVVLYQFGGLCVYEPRREKLSQRFIVLLMGPTAGFMLAGALIAYFTLVHQISPSDVWRLRIPEVRWLWMRYLLAFLLEINIYWGLMNLLPVFPLDGGQMATIILGRWDPRSGVRRSLILSMATAALVATYAVWQQELLAALTFGLLAFRSYQMLQGMHYQSKYGDSFESDDDWWKR